MTPILDSLPSDITIDGHHIWLNITKEITGSYSGGYKYEKGNYEYGFYLNDYQTIEELAQAIQNKLNQN